MVRTNQTLLALQMGHKRFGYLSTQPIVPETFRKNFERSQCKGFSYCTQSQPIRALGSTLKKLNNAAFRYFFDPAGKVNTQLTGPRRVPLFRQIDQAVTAGDTALVVQLLRKLQTLPAEQFSLGAIWNLYGMLSASEQYGSVVAVDDIYNAQQMVMKFKSFSNMVDTLCERIQQEQTEPTTKLSNTAFLYMIKYIDLHLTEDCSLQQLSREMNMTANYLGQVFKRETGKSYTQYITELRIARSKEMLLSGDLSIGEIGTALGFNDYFYFLKTFKRITGMTPKQYRQEQGILPPEEDFPPPPAQP